jgi:hypothetical protein
VSKDQIAYRVTFVEPRTWTAPWTAALDLKAMPDEAGDEKRGGNVPAMMQW